MKMSILLRSIRDVLSGEERDEGTPALDFRLRALLTLQRKARIKVTPQTYHRRERERATDKRSTEYSI